MTDLTPLADVFARRVFRVPDYQRGYAWKPIHRQDLLEDLEGLERLEGTDRRHFMGTLVLHRQSDPVETEATRESFNRLHIVDGQQRLTTLVILLNEIARHLEGTESEVGQHTARKIREQFVAYTSPGEQLPRLELQGQANHFLHEVVLGHGAGRRPNVPAEENLLNAHREFKTYLRERYEAAVEQEDGSAGEELLLGLKSNIIEDLGFVVYEVDRQAQVGIMFEVMNARGKSLTQLEKVKNYLLYMTSHLESEQEGERLSEKINDTWRKLLETFQRFDASDENQYLRYHWIIYPEAPEEEDAHEVSDVHRSLKDTINLRRVQADEISQSVEDYARSLSEMRETYASLVEPSAKSAFDVLGEKAEAAARHAAAINRIGRPATVRPLMMALHRKFEDAPDRLVELFRLLEVFCFRTSAMEFYANKGRNRLYRCAREAAKGEVDGYEGIRRELMDAISEICPDARVRKSLSDPDRDFYDWNQLRFFLYEYERHLEHEQNLQRAPEWHELKDQDLDQTIEHILPKGENTLDVDYWEDQFSEEEWRSYRHRLGNLCLTDWNANYGNRGFDEKCRHETTDPDQPSYRNSPWHQERELVKFDDWTPDAIEKRHEKLVDFALDRWSI